MQSVEFLANLLTADICGILIAKSWWLGLAQDRHQEELLRLLRHSSFCWIKLDVDGFAPEPVAAPVPIRQIPGPNNIRVRLPDWLPASCRGHPASGAGLPLPLHCGLGSAVSGRDRGGTRSDSARGCFKARPGPPLFRPVPTDSRRDLADGGRPVRGADRAIAPDNGGVPLVAKIADLPQLEQEMRRFREFIQSWDGSLWPRLHFHAGRGLILFRWWRPADGRGNPLQHLKTAYKPRCSTNSITTSPRGPDEDRLAELNSRAVAKLQGLNTRPSRRSDIESWAWIGLEPLEASLGKGIDRACRSRRRACDVFAPRHSCRRTLLRLSKRATVHGDVHLRNILARDDVEPHFIRLRLQRARTPLFDVVRLESALWFQFFRPTSDERSVGRLVRGLLDGDSFETVARRISRVGNARGEPSRNPGRGNVPGRSLGRTPRVQRDNSGLPDNPLRHCLPIAVHS